MYSPHRPSFPYTAVPASGSCSRSYDEIVRTRLYTDIALDSRCQWRWTMQRAYPSLQQRERSIVCDYTFSRSIDTRVRSVFDAIGVFVDLVIRDVFARITRNSDVCMAYHGQQDALHFRRTRYCPEVLGDSRVVYRVEFVSATHYPSEHFAEFTANLSVTVPLSGT